MAVGSFGKRIFSTSDSRILTFTGFSYRTSARFADHETLSAKPKTEYLGKGLDEVSFTVTLRADMGLHVRKELEAWRNLASSGSAERLIVGKKRLGGGQWIVTDLSETWNVVAANGAILSATMEVSLREYC